MSALVTAVKTVSAGSASFLVADKVAKGLPPTTGWALGWGAAATLGSYWVASKVADNTTVGAAVPVAVGIGVAAAYLHAYAHQTHYPHRSLP